MHVIRENVENIEDRRYSAERLLDKTILHFLIAPIKIRIYVSKMSIIRFRIKTNFKLTNF